MKLRKFISSIKEMLIGRLCEDKRLSALVEMREKEAKQKREKRVSHKDAWK
jgi:hypothetical protein